MAASQKDLARAGAAAMAHATQGRKTEFRSARQHRQAARLADFEDEIEEALEAFKKLKKIKL